MCLVRPREHDVRVTRRLELFIRFDGTQSKRKYFEHAGALLTADGTDDDKIKLESAPKDYKLDLAAAAAARATAAAAPAA